MKAENTIALAALFGGVAVIAGAFGAHSLKNVLETNELSSFETAVRYQLFHAIMLILTGLMAKMEIKNYRKSISLFFIFGILLFSGSIYLLLILKYNQINYPSFLGLITPIGGVLLITGWAQMFYQFLKSK